MLRIDVDLRVIFKQNGLDFDSFVDFASARGNVFLCGGVIIIRGVFLHDRGQSHGNTL